MVGTVGKIENMLMSIQSFTFVTLNNTKLFLLVFPNDVYLFSFQILAFLPRKMTSKNWRQNYFTSDINFTEIIQK